MVEDKAAADVQPQAALVFAQEQAARYQHLEQTGYGTVQNSQQYTSQLHQ
jgi:membrane fusion protein, multidrug efflux system